MEFSYGQQFKVGIFVFIGVLVICLSIIFLGEDKMSFSGSHLLKVQFNQVPGLSKGSMISLAGVRVGNVERIEFASDSQNLVVVMKIDKAFEKRITEGTTATVKTLGALGDKYVYLKPGPVDGIPLKNGGFIPSETGDDLFDVIAKRGPELGNIVDVINEMNTLLKNLNQDNRSLVLMDNLITTTREFRQLALETRESLDKKKLREAIDRMANIMSKIDRGEGTLGALINDPSLHQKLTGMLGEAPRRQFLKPLIRDTIKERERVQKN